MDTEMEECGRNGEGKYDQKTLYGIFKLKKSVLY